MPPRTKNLVESKQQQAVPKRKTSYQSKLDNLLTTTENSLKVSGMRLDEAAIAAAEAKALDNLAAGEGPSNPRHQRHQVLTSTERKVSRQ